MTIAVNIRGTGGSGKSTLVRRVMELLPLRTNLMVPGRKQPMGTLLFSGGPSEARVLPAQLFVPGHYETPCGGCDTIKTPDEVYRLVNEYVGSGTPVLYEGIMVSDDVRRAVELDKRLNEHDTLGPVVHLSGLGGVSSCSRCGTDASAERLCGRLYVIALTTPVDVCLERIRGRRAAAGNDKPLSEKNTRDRDRRLQGVLHRLKDAGVVVEKLDGEAAFLRIRELLGV